MATWTGLGDNTELFWAVLSHHRGQLNEIMANNGYRKKHKKNQGLCMQGTILAVVVLIIGVVLDSYLTAGLSKN
jgi:hypothetical protein